MKLYKYHAVNKNALSALARKKIWATNPIKFDDPFDCDSRRYMDLGYGDGSVSNIKMYDDIRWTEAIQGSSKSDLVNYVCKKGLD